MAETKNKITQNKRYLAVLLRIVFNGIIDWRTLYDPLIKRHNQQFVVFPSHRLFVGQFDKKDLREKKD